MQTPHAIDSILKSVGRTPLVRLSRLEQPGGPRLYAKVEYLGPGGSIFDRAAVAQATKASLSGCMGEGAPLTAAGGTDAVISLAMVASATGHPLTVYAPRSMLPERKRVLLDYGAKVVSVDDDAGLSAANDRALETKSLGACLSLGKPVVDAYAAIGEELIEALGTAPALTVCGLDLGAIPTGIAQGLKGAPVLAVEPETARIGSGGPFGPHLQLGLAPGPEPIALDRSLVTDFEAVDDRAAWDMAERLSRETGLLAGLASGAVLVAALRRLPRYGSDDVVVAVLPDMGERRFMLADFFA